MVENKELCILITEDDKTGSSIAKMSNFFDSYIKNLSEEIKSNTESDVVQNIQLVDISIINEVLQCADVVMNGKYAYIADFDSLPTDVKEKLRKGIYSIGESRQVERNLRAVILDEKGIRIKDVTLKKVTNKMETMDIARNMVVQMQLRQINTKLSIIQEMQSYQIDMMRNQSIMTPFFNARDFIFRAQVCDSIEGKKKNLNTAIEELTRAINFLYMDIETNKKRLICLTKVPVFQITPLIHMYVNNLAQDIQMITKFVGIQMQVLDYLENKESVLVELNKYCNLMNQLSNQAINKNGKSTLRFIHDHFPSYNKSNQGCWIELERNVKKFLEMEQKELEGMYVISVEDVYEK